MSDGAAKSVLSEDMQELNQGQENISNSIQGHKANLSNPSTSPLSPIACSGLYVYTKLLTRNAADTSEKSKENSRQAIEALGGDAQHTTGTVNPQSKSAAENLEGSRAA